MRVVLRCEWGERRLTGLLMDYNNNMRSTQLNTIDSLWWNTLTSAPSSEAFFKVGLILWVLKTQRNMEDGWSPNGIYVGGGEQSHSLHNQAPNWNTIDSLWWNTLTSGTVTLLLYWFCECQSSTTGGRMVSKWIVWGRAVSCLHNQATQLKHNWLLANGIHWHQVQWHY